ncbi:MAG: signal peptide peptidase SppA [Xanthomonadales bacterium]|nr:signal peptide peptidase SppA [Xanthomonadales bacterium]
MSTGETSFLGRAWRGFWRSLDMFRKIILNLVFFLIFFIIMISIFSGAEGFKVASDSTLVINPKGVVVEAFSGQPAQRLIDEAMEREDTETRLRDLVDAINKAAGDSRINSLLLIPDGMRGIGLASLHELENAITQFKTSGKPVITYAENLSQHQYYFAAQADEVWLSPTGSVLIDGYASYRNYYKEALEKLSVQINLFRVGTYKSAMEPFIRNDMSAEAKQAGRYWLNSLWEQYLDGISVVRDISAEKIEADINNFAQILQAANGDMAQAAVDMNLVDRLLSRPEFRAEMILRGKQGSDDSFRQVNFKDYLAAFKLSNIPKPASDITRVAIIVAEGEIVGGKKPAGLISSEVMARQIRTVAADKDLDALVIRVNSPGGSAFASEIIRREIQVVRDRGKPVVISMGDVAASGGYWIATTADKIIADPATITGSIGIFGMIPTFPDTLARMGIYTDGFGTTSLAGGLRLDRELNPKVAEIFQRATERGYDDFLQRVASARNMTIEEVNEVAQGRVWTGEQALARGLIDQLGGLSTAIGAAALLVDEGAGLEIEYQEPKLSTFEEFLLGMTTSAIAYLPGDLFISSDFLQRPLVRDFFARLDFLANSEPGFATYARCFMCEVE